MNNFTKLAAAFMSAAFLTIAPAHARIEAETGALLDLMEDNGISVTINSDACDGSIHGNYTFVGMRRQLNLCPGQEVDAIDHLTVRHEAIHALQHCVNVIRRTPLNSPIQEDQDKLIELINETVPADVVTWIKTAYPQNQWWVEFEAQALSLALTSSEIMELFSRVCTAK